MSHRFLVSSLGSAKIKIPGWQFARTRILAALLLVFVLSLSPCGRGDIQFAGVNLDGVEFGKMPGI